MLQIVVFSLVTALAVYWAYRQFSKIRSTIFLGKPYSATGPTGPRWKNVFLIAFGQQKMFKRWIPAVMHLFIYVAFIFTQIELIEILIDGFSGVHRFFAPRLGGFYTFIINFIEILSALALIGTIVFLTRRNILKTKRFQQPEMKAWPSVDANLILVLEILLIGAIFTMNGSDVILQQRDPGHYPDTGTLLLSSQFAPVVFGSLPTDWLMWLERAGWWGHILVVYAFLNYLPISKHLHILFAFPNTYYANPRSRGEMTDIPEVTTEIKSMLGLPVEGDSGSDSMEDIPEFGAKDVLDLTWKNLLDAYTCTECGRCTSVCPANMTGKKLSPRKIMMDIRDRATEVKKKLDTKSIEYLSKTNRDNGQKLTKETFDDGKSLFDYITEEEVWACTTCNACVEACPVMIDPLDAILQLRRYKILTESAGPGDWMPMFNSLESGGSVWQVSEDRENWTQEFVAK